MEVVWGRMTLRASHTGTDATCACGLHNTRDACERHVTASSEDNLESRQGAVPGILVFTDVQSSSAAGKTFFHT